MIFKCLNVVEHAETGENNATTLDSLAFLNFTMKQKLDCKKKQKNK